MLVAHEMLYLLQVGLAEFYFVVCHRRVLEKIEYLLRRCREVPLHAAKDGFHRLLFFHESERFLRAEPADAAGVEIRANEYPDHYQLVMRYSQPFCGAFKGEHLWAYVHDLIAALLLSAYGKITNEPRCSEEKRVIVLRCGAPRCALLDEMRAHCLAFARRLHVRQTHCLEKLLAAFYRLASYCRGA